MSTNFIYFTDPHFRGNNPISRKDNFLETALNKLRWVVNYANDHDAAIICGGDWVHRPDTAPNVIAQIQEVLGEATNPIFTVLGNHDIYGTNPGTFFRTPLHIIEVAGTLRRLSAEPTVWRGVQLTGVDSHFDLDQNGRTVDYTEVQRVNWAGTPVDYANIAQKSIPSIHVVHGFLTDHLWPNVACTLLKDVADTKTDLLLTGHEHSGFGIQQHHNGKLFCNPGSLLRVTASVGDIGQVVKVLHVVVNTSTREFNLKLIPLPESIARPAEEVLDRERLVAEREAEQRSSEFYNSLDGFALEPTKNAFQLLQEIAESDNLPSSLVEKLRSRLEMADLELARIRRQEKDDA